MIDLKPFISTDESRLKITEAWMDGKNAVATDNKILIIVFDQECNRSPDLPQPPDIGFIQKHLNEAKEGAWIKAPTLNELDPLRDCETCAGFGDHECKDCGSPHKCEQCDGTGKVPSPATTLIGELLYKDWYLAKIAALLNPKVQPLADPNLLLFRFDGGIGVLMPCRKAGKL